MAVESYVGSPQLSSAVSWGSVIDSEEVSKNGIGRDYVSVLSDEYEQYHRRTQITKESPFYFPDLGHFVSRFSVKRGRELGLSETDSDNDYESYVGNKKILNSWQYVTPVQIWNRRDKLVWIDGNGWMKNPYNPDVYDEEGSRKMRKRRKKKREKK